MAYETPTKGTWVSPVDTRACRSSHPRLALYQYYTQDSPADPHCPLAKKTNKQKNRHQCHHARIAGGRVQVAFRQRILLIREYSRATYLLNSMQYTTPLSIHDACHSQKFRCSELPQMLPNLHIIRKMQPTEVLNIACIAYLVAFVNTAQSTGTRRHCC